MFTERRVTFDHLSSDKQIIVDFREKLCGAEWDTRADVGGFELLETKSIEADAQSLRNTHETIGAGQ